ncbi:propanediol utilization protein, partial [Bacillus sp. SIMBA_008]
FKIHELDEDEILEILREYGIEGSGGAKFPTHLKLNLKNREITSLIINAAECEPYLSADYALLSSKFEELKKAITILKKAIKA